MSQHIIIECGAHSRGTEASPAQTHIIIIIIIITIIITIIIIIIIVLLLLCNSAGCLYSHHLRCA